MVFITLGRLLKSKRIILLGFYLDILKVTKGSFKITFGVHRGPETPSWE